VGELSQWRLYGADGRGIAIVIDANSEKRRIQIEKLASLPRKVVYGVSDGLKLVKNEVQSFLNGLETHLVRQEAIPQIIPAYALNTSLTRSFGFLA
jgi:hypothetical protein